MIKWGFRNSESGDKLEKIIEEINAPLVTEHKRLMDNRLEKEKGYRCDCMCVATHKAYTRRGIAANLTKCLMANIKKEGFKVAYA